MVKPTYHEDVIHDDIPADLARYVGRIIVKWASFEYRVQILVRMLVGVDEVTSRIALREPRISDRLRMVSDLAKLRGIKLDRSTFGAFTKSASALEGKRDLVAHSPWVRRMGEIKIISYRGNVNDQSLSSDERSRRLRPESLTVNAESMVKIVQAMDNLISFIRKLTIEIEGRLSAAQKKSL